MTTLLDDAAPGRRHASAAEIVDLLRGGVRARLRPTRGGLPRAVCVMVAVSVALVTSSAAVLASPFPGPPAEAVAVDVAMIAVGQAPHNVPSPVRSCGEVDCALWDGRDDVVAEDFVPESADTTVVYYNPPWAQAPAIAGRARERLAAAGWRVEPWQTTADGGKSFDASTDMFRVHVYTARYRPQELTYTNSLTIYVSKRVSSATIVSVAGAFVAGLMAGWLAGAWVTHRYRRHPLLRRLCVTLAAIPFLAITMLVIAYTFIFVMSDAASGIGDETVEAPLAFILFARPITVLSVLGGLSGLAALMLTALPSRGRDTQRLPDVGPGSGLVAGQ